MLWIEIKLAVIYELQVFYSLHFSTLCARYKGGWRKLKRVEQG